MVGWGQVGPVAEQPQYNMLERQAVEVEYQPSAPTHNLALA